MVPFSDAGLSGIFRLIHVDVAPYSPTLRGVEPSGHARSVTSESTECDSDRISKIRARLYTRNKQLYTDMRPMDERRRRASSKCSAEKCVALRQTDRQFWLGTYPRAPHDVLSRRSDTEMPHQWDGPNSGRPPPVTRPAPRASRVCRRPRCVHVCKHPTRESRE